MKTKIISGLFGISSLLMVGLANAATVQINPASITVANGAAFDLTVEGANFDVATAGGGFELTWDPTVLSMTSTVDVIGASLVANGFDAFNLVGGVIIDPAGTLQVAAATFFEPAKLGDFNIATLSFEALQPGTTTADLGIFALQSDWLQEDGITPLVNQPNYLGAEINIDAVPVPASVWFFGTGMLGMVGIARRRKAKLALS